MQLFLKALIQPQTLSIRPALFKAGLFILLFIVAPKGLSTPFCVDLSKLYYEKNPDHMTREVVQLDSVDRQCGGTCWLYSRIVETENRLSTNSRINMDLSPDYLIMHMLRERFISFIAKGNNAKPPSLKGARADYFASLIRENGLMPKTAWPAGIVEWKKLAPELELKARNIHDVYLRTAEEQRHALLEKAGRLFDIFIQNRIGTIPPTFFANGKEVSPLQFFAEQAELAAKRVVTYGSNETVIKNLHRNAFHDARIETPEAMMARIKKRIDRNEVVPMGMFWRGRIIVSRGLLHEGQNFQKGDPSTQAADLDGKGEHGRHAVVVVGYRLNAEEKIIALKIRNSWGDKHGLDGYDYIDADLFSKVVLYVQDTEPM